MEYASSYIFCTLIFLNFACSLDKISLNLKWFIIRELTNSNYIYITTDSIKQEKPPLDFHIPQ
jgi:hypothetical protein